MKGPVRVESAPVARAGLERRAKQAGVLLALLCPLAWLLTSWHLALEAHHVHAVEEHDHHEDEGEGHHPDDHLIPDSLRPEHGPAYAIDLPPSEQGRAPATTPTPAAAPFDDVPPATDPPVGSRRPRAPPVG
jgi:hypothetical protein